ncbi:hypothetical protein, partial [Pseudomonas fluorescens]|uniref:hypothetical protein n=1 Tax=Pseudomonas fluorescens TaxID=294 RepID=UPI001C637096
TLWVVPLATRSVIRWVWRVGAEMARESETSGSSLAIRAVTICLRMDQHTPKRYSQNCLAKLA